MQVKALRRSRRSGWGAKLTEDPFSDPQLPPQRQPLRAEAVVRTRRDGASWRRDRQSRGSPPTRGAIRIRGCRYGHPLTSRSAAHRPADTPDCWAARVAIRARAIHADALDRDRSAFSPIHVDPSILQICRALRHDYRQIVSRCNLVYPTRMVAIVRSTARTWRWCSTRCRKSSSVLDLKLKWESHAVQHTKNSHEYLAHY